jgi:hypothetical protein
LTDAGPPFPPFQCWQGYRRRGSSQFFCFTLSGVPGGESRNTPNIETGERGAHTRGEKYKCEFPLFCPSYGPVDGPRFWTKQGKGVSAPGAKYKCALPLLCPRNGPFDGPRFVNSLALFIFMQTCLLVQTSNATTCKRTRNRKTERRGDPSSERERERERA